VDLQGMRRTNSRYASSSAPDGFLAQERRRLAILAQADGQGAAVLLVSYLLYPAHDDDVHCSFIDLRIDGLGSRPSAPPSLGPERVPS
jgi:hypothetical protein